MVWNRILSSSSCLSKTALHIWPVLPQLIPEVPPNTGQTSPRSPRGRATAWQQWKHFETNAALFKQDQGCLCGSIYCSDLQDFF